MHFYLNKHGQRLAPTEVGRLWAGGWSSWMSLRSESTHQLVIAGAQGSREPLEGKQRGTLLTSLDHLDVSLSSGLTGSGQQLFPLTPQRDSKPDEGCYQDVDVPCFDLLHATDIEVSQLSQLLLSHRLHYSLASQVCTERLQLAGDGASLGHAPLGRTCDLA
jgi:hypothetical protein